MSNDEDIFLRTFNQMILLLKEVNANIASIKNAVEVILPSIDGLGAGLTNTNLRLLELMKKIDAFSIEYTKLAEPSHERIESIPKQPIKEKQHEMPSIKGKAPSTQQLQPQSYPTQWTHTKTPKHPIFMDLQKKIDNATKFNEIGEILITSLENIEASFPFSRVFYEIRRYANNQIRKGDSDLNPNDKIELFDKLLEWEKRLVEQKD